MRKSKSPEELYACLEATANSFMQSAENDLGMPNGFEPAFDMPLYGVASGADPLWTEYKKYVGPFHWTPLEAFTLKYPNTERASADLSVFCWILPQTEATRRDNRKEKAFPSERWARARIIGEEKVNSDLRDYLQEALAKEGIQSVAAQRLAEWQRKDSPDYVFASTWSERHAAHAAGLGTFGLCDGLITAKGKAVRVGSIIIDLPLAPSGRPYRSYQEYCLFFNSGTCGACIKRCPVDSLTERGHDKLLCRDFIHNASSLYIADKWNLEGYGCGLCQVGVPCERKIPKAR